MQGLGGLMGHPAVECVCVGVIGFERSCGEGAVFPWDGHDADGKCKRCLGKSTGMVLEGAGGGEGPPSDAWGDPGSTGGV